MWYIFISYILCCNKLVFYTLLAVPLLLSPAHKEQVTWLQLMFPWALIVTGDFDLKAWEPYILESLCALKVWVQMRVLGDLESLPWSHCIPTWESLYAYLGVLVSLLGSPCIPTWESLYPYLGVLVSLPGGPCISTWKSLYPYLKVLVSLLGSPCIPTWESLYPYLGVLVSLLGSPCIPTWKSLYPYLGVLVSLLGSPYLGVLKTKFLGELLPVWLWDVLLQLEPLLQPLPLEVWEDGPPKHPPPRLPYIAHWVSWFWLRDFNQSEPVTAALQHSRGGPNTIIYVHIRECSSQ